MRKQLLFVCAFLMVLVSYAQEPNKDSIRGKNEIVDLRGQIIDYASKKVLVGAHIFNLNLVTGTISDDKGNFELPTKSQDTVYISYLGFQSIKLKITNDLLKGNELVIELHETTQQLKEVTVKYHKLIGVLEIDAKNVPEDKYARIHINGLAQTYEVGVKRSRTYNSPVDALIHPIDYVYNMFGRKPRQLAKLKKLRDDSKLRNMLEANFNRELMMEYLNMDANELNDLLNECNYSDYFINAASDLQLIEAVLLCYDNYKAIKKGSTLKEN